MTRRGVVQQTVKSVRSVENQDILYKLMIVTGLKKKIVLHIIVAANLIVIYSVKIKQMFASCFNM